MMNNHRTLVCISFHVTTVTQGTNSAQILFAWFQYLLSNHRNLPHIIFVINCVIEDNRSNFSYPVRTAYLVICILYAQCQHVRSRRMKVVGTHTWGTISAIPVQRLGRKGTLSITSMSQYVCKVLVLNEYEYVSALRLR
jgi:hypothetical protein